MNNRAFSKAEAAAIVGCCEKTIERLIASGAIKAHRVGNRWKVFQVDLDAYLEAGVNRLTSEQAGQPIAVSGHHVAPAAMVGV
jgi:excisionase family DNA binding protein